MAATITKEAFLQYYSSLSLENVLEMLLAYFQDNGIGGSNIRKQASALILQQRMEAAGVNVVCPECGSISHIKYGRQASGLTCYKCKDCGRKFNSLSNTILDKSHIPDAAWVKVLEMTNNGISIERIRTTLEDDYNLVGINTKTVWLMRMKMICALASFPQPVLTGNIQIDETFPRESQKGTRALQNPLPSKLAARLPRIGYSPSFFGTTGPEFANVTTAIDDTGHCVCFFVGMGRLTIDPFMDAFDSHICDPNYICTDANAVYDQYCKVKGYNHYIRPSTYMKELEAAGVVMPSNLYPVLTNEDKQQNDRIMRNLFRQGKIDSIRPYCGYDEMRAIRNSCHLSLARVNKLHSEFKEFINIQKTNVASKYLADYVGYFSYIHNWAVDHGHYPSSYLDAQAIFMEILKNKGNITAQELRNKKPVFAKPTGRYDALLAEHTKAMRKSKPVPYFKYDAEDLSSFNKRDFFNTVPPKDLRRILRENNVTGYSGWSKHSLVTRILKLPNVQKIMYTLIVDKRIALVDEEDIKANASRRYIC